MKTTIVKQNDQNVKLLREFTGMGMLDCRKAIDLHRQQKMHPVYRQRILACKDLESLKLELVKMFEEINPTPSVRFPMDRMLSVLEDCADSFETEKV